MKLLIAVPAEGSVPLLEFFGLLDEKQRQKPLSLFALLLQSPAAVMREPYVKHFCIERYQALYTDMRKANARRPSLGCVLRAFHLQY